MNEQKSFLVDLAETVERHLPQRSQGAESASPQCPGRLHWLARQLVPNVGTLILVAVMLFAIPTIAAPLRGPSAASISTIPYQGRLADASGNPITDKQNMEFRIYDVPTGGGPLWEEFWTGGNSVNVSDGLFSVMLGSINTDLASVVQGHDPLYLGITVGTDSEMEPRVQLGSVPFSIWSLTVADDSITGDKIADDAVGSSEIATNAVGSAEIADDAVGSNEIAANAVGSEEIADGCITTEKITGGAVTQVEAPFAPLTYWYAIDSTPDPNMKLAIVTSVFDPGGSTSIDIDTSAYDFTTRPLGICEISDTAGTVAHYFCAYSWDGSDTSTAHVRLFSYDDTASGPYGNIRITLFLMGK